MAIQYHGQPVARARPAMPPASSSAHVKKTQQTSGGDDDSHARAPRLAASLDSNWIKRDARRDQGHERLAPIGGSVASNPGAWPGVSAAGEGCVIRCGIHEAQSITPDRMAGCG